MQKLTKTLLVWTTISIAVGSAAASTGRISVSFGPGVPVAKTVKAAEAIAALKPARPPVISLSAAPVMKTASLSEQALRSKLKFDTVQFGGKTAQTLAESSRIALVKAAAEKAGLASVGLSFHDIYGLIEAETSWIARTGASKNGTPNLGLAQFEPATAKALGIADPSDPVEAVFGAARHMKDAATWASTRIASLKLSPDERSAKLREGVSIYYNLSVKGRNKWDGLNTAQLPIETQRHIRNTRAGAFEAVQLARLVNA